MQIWDDLKFSFRLLRKTPAFTCTLLLIIVLSLSLYLAGYTVGTFMGKESMPFPRGDSYIALRARDSITGNDVGRQEHDAYFLNRLRETSDNYVELGGFNRSVYILSDGDYSERYAGFSISTNLFLGLETPPILGRNISADDAQPGAEKVVLISHTVWQDYYGGDSMAVGNTSLVNGEPHTIIGVMPAGFNFPSPAQLWTPLTISDALQPGEGLSLTLVGVLKEGRSYNRAEAELTTLLAREAEFYPDHYGNRIGMVHDYADGFAGEDISPNPVAVLNTTTLMILLLAVVNLSSMLFIRLNARKQELLVRSSLGASGWQLSKQIMLESFLICFIGLILSLIVSSLLLRLLEYSIVEQGLSFGDGVNSGLNLQGVLAGFASILAIWLSSCLFVAVRAFQSNPGDVLESANKGNDGAGASSATRLIVGFELVLSCFLLVCCGVFFYLGIQIVNTDYGTDPDGLAVAFMNLSQADYDNAANRFDYTQQLQLAVAEIPGVQQVAMTNALPARWGTSGTYSISEIDTVSENLAPAFMTIWTSNSYFDTIDVDLLSGRGFDATDSVESNRVAILSESFAQLLWPNESPIGKEILSTIQNQTEALRVVGVIPDLVQGRSDILSAVPSLYRPLSQNPPRNLSIVVRHAPQTLVNALGLEIRRVAAEVDRNTPLYDVRSLEDQIINDQEAIGTFGNISAIFALVTLILAAMGIYSVMARSILYRTHEIGVRRALGSTNDNITWKFLKQSFRFLLPTTIIGAGLACAVIVLSANSLGITDIGFVPYIVILVIFSMMAVVMTATYLPSQKAIAMEPGDALRYE